MQIEVAVIGYMLYQNEPSRPGFLTVTASNREELEQALRKEFFTTMLDEYGQGETKQEELTVRKSAWGDLEVTNDDDTYLFVTLRDEDKARFGLGVQDGN